MHLREISSQTANRVTRNPMEPLRVFISDHLDGLRNAACLLAGARGGRLVDTIMDRLRDGARISRCTWLALRDLLGILTLEHVHDESRPEAGYFARIDPSDPVVDEICLLTDGLRAALENALETQPEAMRLLAVA
ncbi:hypothetical protein [Acidimangrovimonas pyrenivorans]|uniref:Uncharacterized protein n=1 Tax=Acidimangrovimonas pyrenivorans TaxID=2030798 RepID=A0ABV7ACT6_9RHOB